MAAASLLSIIRWKRRGLNLSSVCPAAAPAPGWTWSCAALPTICAAKWIGKSASVQRGIKARVGSQTSGDDGPRQGGCAQGRPEEGRLKETAVMDWACIQIG